MFEKNRPGVTNATIAKMRQQITLLEKRAGKVEQRADKIEAAQADASLGGVIVALRDIAKAIRECGSGGYTDDQLAPVMVAVDDILIRLRIVDAAVGGKGD